MSLHLLGQRRLLQLTPMLKKLLDNIIPENIRHELERIRLDLAENGILLIAVGRLELELDESRAVLVTAEFNDVVVNVLVFVSVCLWSISAFIP